MKNFLLISALCCSFNGVAQAREPKKVASNKASVSASNRPLVTVNGVAIPLARAQLLMPERQGVGTPASTELQNKVRMQLVLLELQVQQAKALQLDKNPNLIERQRMAADELLAQAYRQDFINTHPASEEAISQSYSALKARAGEFEFHLHNLLFDTEEAAKEAMPELRSLEKFTALARQSKDQEIQKSGGDLGWVSLLNLLPHVVKTVADQTKPGLIETPIKGPAGWNVILIEEIRPFAMPPLEGTLHQQLAGEITRRTLEAKLGALAKSARID